MKVAVVSLGCAKNLVDSEVMLGLLRQHGYTLTGDEATAEILIVNTCGFIESAKQESIETILELAQYKQTGHCQALVVTGCLVQRYGAELMQEMPEIDAAVGTGEFPQIIDVVEQVLQKKGILLTGEPRYLYNHTAPRVVTTPGYTTYVKVAEGCDNCCAYCVIPSIRGSFRSRPLESVVAEVEELAKTGIKEINLIAQDTTLYGADLYGKPALPQLLRALVKIEGVVWIRLLYCYPTHFTDELIELMAQEPKICKYIDLPLQHASNRLLQAMGRQGTCAENLMLINRLRAAMPEITLRTSFIVGLPGETAADFQELLAFMRTVEFDRAGVFTYSQEEGTPAAEMPEQVSAELKQARYTEAMTLQQQIALKKNKRWLNREINVIIEGNLADNPEIMVGRTERDAPEVDGQIYINGQQHVTGDLVRARVTDADEYDLYGELVEDESGK